MKNRMLILSAMALLLVHCAKKGSSDSSGEVAAQPAAPYVDPNAPYTPPGTGVGLDPGANWQFGGTTDFVFDSADVYRQYTQRYITNLSQLSNVKINLNFDRYTSSYGGTVTIRYMLNNVSYQGYFTSGNTPQTTKYNIWFTKVGQRAWHGFFEDFMGAIVVVIDDATSLDDGIQSTDVVSGSVWFKNFALAGYTHPSTYCWFVTSGAFDCRSWPLSGGVDTTAAIFPNNGYKRLGTFTNLPVQKAFNDLSL